MKVALENREKKFLVGRNNNSCQTKIKLYVFPIKIKNTGNIVQYLYIFVTLSKNSTEQYVPVKFTYLIK